MSLTLLAPDIVEAILAGNEPSGLPLERLTRELPMLWGDPRRWVVAFVSAGTPD